MKRKILVGDDHEIVRHGLRRLIETQTDWEVCGEAASGREAVEKAQQLQPDVVVLDFSMPELNGVEAARQILKILPRTEIVMLTIHNSERLLREALDAGVRGYVLKSDAMSDVVSAIRSLLQHRTYLSPGLSGTLVSGFMHASAPQPSDRLTPREREIVQLLAEGKSNKEVAECLNISVKTVEVHRAHIMHKLNLASLSDLVHFAIRNKIVEA